MIVINVYSAKSIFRYAEHFYHYPYQGEAACCQARRIILQFLKARYPFHPWVTRGTVQVSILLKDVISDEAGGRVLGSNPGP